MRLGTKIRSTLRKLSFLLRGNRPPASPIPERNCVSPSSTTFPTLLTDRIAPRASLTDLPTELVYQILSYVSDGWKDITLPSVSRLAQTRPRGTSSPLVALSMVNRRLRFLCQPALFRLLSVDPTGPLPPTNVLQYVQVLQVLTASSPATWEISNHAVLNMRHLSRVHWHGTSSKQQSLAHLLIFLSSPTLHSLSISNVWLAADGTDLESVNIGLRALRIDFPGQVQNRSPSRPQFVAAHLDCLHALLDVVRPRLESLTLSGYSARLSSLAAAPWPALRVFSLTRGDAVLDAPWTTLLRQMPELSSFTVALDRGRRPLILFPEPAPADSNLRLLSRLREFTMSFPQADDSVFGSLPPDLQTLSLRDTPRYYTFREHHLEFNDQEVALTSSAVLRIFGVLSAVRPRALELVYVEDQEEVGMRNLLTRSCPNLTFLELHRYPAELHVEDDWYHGRLVMPVDAIADWLAEFKSLRLLKLNLCFTDKQTERQGWPADYYERFAVFLEAHALTVARRVSWLRMISLLAWARGACAMHWDTWSVHLGDAADPPRLVHEDIYHEAFYGCDEWDYL